LFREKTAVAGFMRRHKMMEFEKSRLTGAFSTRDAAFSGLFAYQNL
jgi:hypothetical protein